jgi:microcystin-dependent protein
MATQTTPNLGLPYPDDDEPVDVPADIEALARAVDAIGPVPVGSLVMWPTATPPQFWLLCNGLTVPEGTYPKLAAVLGATGGMITLPDLRNRVGIGAGTDQALGSAGGAKEVLLVAGQGAIPGGVKTGLRDRAQTHFHSPYPSMRGDWINGNPGQIGVWNPGWAIQAPYGFQNNAIVVGTPSGVTDTKDVPDHQHHTIATNAQAPHENRPPFLAINFIIRAS